MGMGLQSAVDVEFAEKSVPFATDQLSTNAAINRHFTRYSVPYELICCIALTFTGPIMPDMTEL